MNRYRDFDAFFAERDRTVKTEPVSFVYDGVTYVLPSELPAIVPIQALKAKANKNAGAELDSGEVISMLSAIVGADAFDRLIATGISVEKLSGILQWVISQYQGVGTDEGNATAPEQAGG